MCGGAGTRLWPASREGRPKQFLPLFGPHSTFQDTVRRVSDPALFGRPIIVTNNQYRFLVAEELAAIGVEADILLEPMRRDSGPAIAAGAAFARQAWRRSGGGGAGRGSCRHRPGGFRQSLRPGGGRRRRGSHRDVRRTAEAAGDRIRLYPRRRGDRPRRFRHREIRRKARRQDRGALRQGRLFVERRQLHVPRWLAA